MKHRIEIFQRVFRFLYEALFSTIILLFFVIVFVKEEPNVLAAIWVFVIFGISYVIREWAPNYLVMFLLHLLLVGVSLFLPIAISEKVISIGYLLFFLLPESVIYAKRFSHLAPLNDIPWPSVLVVFIIYLFGHAVHSEFLANSSYVFMILMLFCYLLLVYVEGLYHYIEQTNDVSGLPLSKIVQTNSRVVVVVMTILLLALLLGRTIHLQWLFDSIKNVFAAVFRMIASVFIFIFGMIARLFMGTNLSEHVEYDVNNTHGFTAYGYTVGAVFDIVLNVFVVMLAVVLLYKIGKRVLKLLLSARTYDKDIIERAETKKNIKREKTNIRKRILPHWSYEDRIRKCYKYTIENFQPDIRLSEDQTCHDIEADISDQELGDVKELTDLYAEVRYGNRKVDKQMLKRADTLSKQAIVKGSV